MNPPVRFDAREDLEPATAATISGIHNGLSLAIEQLVLAIGVDGIDELHGASTRLVMAHAAARNHIGRAWFKPMGFDAAPYELPEPADLLEEPGP